MWNKTIRTKRGYDLYEVASALQKSIRRGDIRIAGYFAMELFASGYANYCWKRLLTVSAEDVESFITKEIVSLHYGFTLINTPKPKEPKGRIFITKAVFILCKAIKSRETDHLQNLLYDRKLGITDEEIESSLSEARDNGEHIDIPDYAYDIHTRKGKISGKTKKMFFLEEQEALLPFGDDIFLSELKEYINEI